MRWNRFRQEQSEPELPVEILLASIGSLFGHKGRSGDTLYGFVDSMPTDSIASILGTLATLEELTSLRALTDYLVDRSPLVSSPSTGILSEFGREIHSTVLRILGVDENLEQRHPFEGQLALATVHANYLASTEKPSLKIADLMTEGLGRLSALVLFAERHSQLSIDQESNSNGDNLAMTELRRDLFERFLEDEEIALNVGPSFLLDGSQEADGYLVITDKRLLFVFDEDFNKSPWIVRRIDITGVDFIPTSAMPMSEIMIVGFKSDSYFEAARMYVGHRFADEIRLINF